MRTPRKLLIVLAILLGTLMTARTARAQGTPTTPPPAATAPTSADVWMGQRDGIKGVGDKPIRLDLGLSWTETSHDDIGGKHRDVGTWAGSASASHQAIDNFGYTGGDLSVGGKFDWAVSSDSDGFHASGVRGRDKPLDPSLFDGQIELTLRSHPHAGNQDFAWMISVGTGLGYLEWNRSHLLWVSSATAEASYNTHLGGIDVGPFARFEGMVGTGRDDTNLVHGLAEFGLRATQLGKLDEVRVGFVTSARMDQANVQRDLNLSEDCLEIGARASVTFLNGHVTVSLGVLHTLDDRFHRDDRRGLNPVVSDNPGGVRLVFGITGSF